MDVSRTTTIQFGTVPVTTGTGTAWRSIYYLPLYNVVAGEVIQMYAEGQIRNDLGYNVELAQVLELKTTVSGGTEAIGGAYASPINGWNVDPTMHYGRWSKGDIWVADDDYSVLYLVARLRCRSSAASGSHAVTVNEGQGLLYCIRHGQPT